MMELEKDNMQQTDPVGGDACRAQAEQAGGVQPQTERSAPLGKFKSVDALLQAYNSLEAEFTRRSQRLRELEGRAAENAAQAAPAGGQMPAEQRSPTGETLNGAAALLPQEVDAAVERAVARMLGRAPYLMPGGTAFAAAPPRRIRSIEEAGELAKSMMQRGEW